MIRSRNRRTRRGFGIGIAATLLFVAPAHLVAQDTTTTVPKTHTVKKGDTLWDLAAMYLADAFRWPEIYKLNTDIVQDPHWIYPGEILKLPGYVGVELPGAGAATSKPEPIQVQPTAPPIPADTTTVEMHPRNEPSIFARPAQVPTAAAPLGARTPTADTSIALPIAPPATVPFGDFVRSPWVERRGGPLVWGRILGSAEIPGIETARQRARFQLNDEVLISPPTGSVAPEHELYLSYTYGPLLEDVGQVIIPTGIVEVVRSPRQGDAAIARVIRMFREVQERDRLMPFDSTGGLVHGMLSPVANGVVGGIRWIPDEPVLPPLENYIVLTLTSRDGIKVGDKLELFQPRQKPVDNGELGIPEIHVGYAQVVRVTPLATTAKITVLDQPKVDQKTTKVRLIGTMQ